MNSDNLKRDVSFWEKKGLELDELWNKSPAGKRIWENRFKHIIQLAGNINKESKILDVGCGIGHMCAALKKYSDNVYGTDVNKYCIEKAKKDYSGVEFTLTDGATLPYPDGFFDLVIASEVLEHVALPEEFVKEMARVCKLNGKLVITTPNSYCPYGLLVRPVMRRIQKDTSTNDYKSKSQLKKYLAKNGFSGITAINFGFMLPIIPEKLLQPTSYMENLLLKTPLRVFSGWIGSSGIKKY